jgi:hypothetical protein
MYDAQLFMEDHFPDHDWMTAEKSTLPPE